MDIKSYEETFESEEFAINDDKTANWAIKKIRDKIAEADRLKAIIIAEREELAEKEKAINEKLDHETGYLKTLLYAYFGKVEHKETKTQQTYKLLDGSLIYKKPSVKIAKPEDDAALIAYLEQNQPEMVETIKKPAWGEFKKNLTLTEDGDVVDMATGEKLDFVKTEETEGSFDVKVV